MLGCVCCVASVLLPEGEGRDRGGAAHPPVQPRAGRAAQEGRPRGTTDRQTDRQSPQSPSGRQAERTSERLWTRGAGWAGRCLSRRGVRVCGVVIGAPAPARAERDAAAVRHQMVPTALLQGVPHAGKDSPHDHHRRTLLVVVVVDTCRWVVHTGRAGAVGLPLRLPAPRVGGPGLGPAGLHRSGRHRYGTTTPTTLNKHQAPKRVGALTPVLASLPPSLCAWMAAWPCVSDDGQSLGAAVGRPVRGTAPAAQLQLCGGGVSGHHPGRGPAEERTHAASSPARRPPPRPQPRPPLHQYSRATTTLPAAPVSIIIERWRQQGLCWRQGPSGGALLAQRWGEL